MSNGILLVEARPNSAEEAEAFHAWYDKVHIPEILTVDGFVSARRLAAVEGDYFITVYEIDTDVETAKAKLGEAHKSGRMTAPQGVQINPPPVVRYFQSFAG